jgi:hypothetical protein
MFSVLLLKIEPLSEKDVSCPQNISDIGTIDGPFFPANRGAM